MKCTAARIVVLLGVVGCGSVSDKAKIDAPPGSDVDAPGVTHVLTVEKTGTGAGTITSSNVAGISCGGDCNEAIGQGASVSLMAAPDTGSIFVKWTGGCTGSGACNVTVNADVTVIAQFAAGGALTFPIGSDSRSQVNANAGFSSDGDLVTGIRMNTGIARATHASLHLVLENNTLVGANCPGSQKTQDVNVSLAAVGANTATILGQIPISAGLTSIDQEFTFASITGPNFRIEYITNATVSAGCGGAGYSNVGSTITLSDQ